MYLIGVLVMVVGIAVSIALHEVGHLVPAKKFGVKVTQYMVGFGPTLWSTRRGETEYGVKAVPLGGYVRMIGMFPPREADGGRLRRSSSNPFHQMVEQARQDSLEEVQPGDEGRVFYRLPVWQRLIVMAGGPLMNLAISAVLVTLLLTLHGVVGTLTPTVAQVAQCANADVADDDCTGQEASPALQAGFMEGDTILSVDGKPVTTWPETTYAIQNAGETAEFVVERDGQEKTLTAELVMRERPLVTEAGEYQLDQQGEPVLGEVGFLGATPTFVYQPQPLSEVPGFVGEMFTGTARIVITLPQRLVDVGQAAFGSEERDPEGPMSVVGVGRVAGDVADGGLWVAESLEARFWILVSLVASLNMALFVFNLIPLLPLDGGHIAGALWEGAKKTWARLRGLPAPGPVDTAAGLPIAYVVALGLLTMTALLIYADIVKPISLG